MSDITALRTITSECAINGVLRHFPAFFSTLGVQQNSARELAHRLADLLKEPSGQLLANIGNLLREDRVGDHWAGALSSLRAERLAAWLAPHVEGARVLDLLCGDGAIGAQLEAMVGKEVCFVERAGQWGVVRRPWLERIQDFDEFSREAERGIYDTVILSTVLHHETDPGATLQLAVHCARRRVLIVENCIEQDFHHDYHLLVDALFNCSLFSTSLAWPGKHRTAEGWLQLCAPYGGVAVLDRSEDVPGIPLAHTLIMLDVDCTQ